MGAPGGAATMAGDVTSVDRAARRGAALPRRGAARGALLGASLCAVAAGCTTGAAPPAAADLASPAPAEVVVPVSSMRRLSNEELALSLADLLSVPVAEIRPELSLLPSEPGLFDNDYAAQVGSTAYFDALFTVVERSVGRALRLDRRQAFVGCAPRTVDDAECLGAFIDRFGRRALRRPLSASERADLSALVSFARDAGDFHAALDAVARALLLHPAFVYRPEVGVAEPGQPGLHRLTQHELATRLAFTLWGRTPPDWLLDLADAGTLGTPDAVRAAAERLLDDPRAAERMRHFHALWLGYKASRAASDAADFVTETDALVDRVTLREPGDYLRLFTHGESFLNQRLVEHYGLPAPAGGFPASGWTWVSYEGTARSGVLGHRSLLANGALVGDSSPVRRGKFVLQRLLCTELGKPPNGVPADRPPSGATGDCKRARYAAHAVGGCAACHTRLDPLGFALENFDLAGRYRTTEDGHPECTVDARGQLPDGRPFDGARGLVDALLASGELERCAVAQWTRFVVGRELAPADQPLVDDLVSRFEGGERRFRALVVETVAHPLFTYVRREEPR